MPMFGIVFQLAEDQGLRSSVAPNDNDDSSIAQCAVIIFALAPAIFDLAAMVEDFTTLAMDAIEPV